MRNEITLHEIGGRKVLKTRVKSPAPRVMKVKTKYSRKPKHKGNSEW